LRTRGIPREEINDVVVTHVHGDHVSGLETLLLWKRYFEKKRVRLHTSKSVFRELKKSFFCSFSQGFSADLKEVISKRFEDYIDFFELAEEQINELEKELTIEIRHNWHPTPTLGLKISYRGKRVAISGDTCYRPALLQELRSTGILSEARYNQLRGGWLWDADVIYHETDGTPDGPHTFLGDLLELPSEIRQRIRLVHIPDEFETEELPIAKEGERIMVDQMGKISWRTDP
jgi:ribonuclease BN (tRNA processing enzyme)